MNRTAAWPALIAATLLMGNSLAHHATGRWSGVVHITMSVVLLALVALALASFFAPSRKH
jgi:hypothetical protein